MDINGAKALKERLSLNGAGEAAAPEAAEVPAHAPPVYRWTGKTPPESTPVYRWTGKTPPESTSPEAEDDNAPPRASLFSRLSLGLR